MQPNAIQDWLTTHCERRHCVTGALVVLSGPHASAPNVAASWPAGPATNNDLFAAARVALDTRAPLMRAQGGAASAARRTARVVSLPVRLGGEPVGAIALEMEASEPTTVRATLSEITSAQASAALRTAITKQAAPAAPGTATLLGIQAAVLSQERFAAAASAFVSELAVAMKFDRITLAHRARSPQWAAAVMLHHERHRSLQVVQRPLRPRDRRSGAASRLA